MVQMTRNNSFNLLKNRPIPIEKTLIYQPFQAIQLHNLIAFS